MNFKQIRDTLQKGDFERVKVLLRASQEGPQKVNLNKRDKEGVTLLCRAVHLGLEDIVRVILECGADLSATTRVVNQEGSARSSIVSMPVLHICMLGHMDAERSRHSSPASCGPSSKHQKILQLLVEKGVHIHQKDSQGKTAADRAIEWGDPSIANYLTSLELAKKEKEVLTQVVLQATPKSLEKGLEPRRYL